MSNTTGATSFQGFLEQHHENPYVQKFVTLRGKSREDDFGGDLPNGCSLVNHRDFGAVLAIDAAQVHEAIESGAIDYSPKFLDAINDVIVNQNQRLIALCEAAFQLIPGAADAGVVEFDTGMKIFKEDGKFDASKVGIDRSMYDYVLHDPTIPLGGFSVWADPSDNWMRSSQGGILNCKEGQCDVRFGDDGKTIARIGQPGDSRQAADDPRFPHYNINRQLRPLAEPSKFDDFVMKASRDDAWSEHAQRFIDLRAESLDPDYGKVNGELPVGISFEDHTQLGKLIVLNRDALKTAKQERGFDDGQWLDKLAPIVCNQANRIRAAAQLCDDEGRLPYTDLKIKQNGIQRVFDDSERGIGYELTGESLAREGIVAMFDSKHQLITMSLPELVDDGIAALFFDEEQAGKIESLISTDLRDTRPECTELRIERT